MLLRRNEGFTLIELMIVVLVISILAAIAVPNFLAMQARAKEAAVKVNSKTVSLAAEDIAIQTGGIYPSTIAPMQGVFPQGNLLQNPFTRQQTEPRLGIGPSEGQITYDPISTMGIVTDGYTIQGGGRAGVIVTIVVNGSV